MKKAIVNVIPQLRQLFVNPCVSQDCFYHKTKSTLDATPPEYAPDKLHDTFLWNEKSYLLGKKTYIDCNAGTTFSPIHYEGFKKIPAQRWHERRNRK